MLEDEQKHTVFGFLTRALAWFNGQGIENRQVMRDNGPACFSKGFAMAYRTRPYTPRTNGKAERFIKTLSLEWAYATAYQNSGERNR